MQVGKHPPAACNATHVSARASRLVASSIAAPVQQRKKYGGSALTTVTHFLDMLYRT